ncbi:hypothetical protein QJS04_geneDACA021538 [Acorus gramineus]|uniref:Uncharacterized protein n=1 Tax=Acorus gramineus TaxID=55184 RepID=A0AAV9B567_ACOGR|nr:hypothetical protein QJS04_geneDACA021538 [Acorus gramineus]
MLNVNQHHHHHYRASACARRWSAMGPAKISMDHLRKGSVKLMIIMNRDVVARYNESMESFSMSYFLPWFFSQFFHLNK